MAGSCRWQATRAAERETCGSRGGDSGLHGRIVEVAGDRPGRRQLAELRLLLPADGHGERAPWVEVTALRSVYRARDIAGEGRLDRLAPGREPGRRAHERLGVGVQRLGENAVGRRVLDDPAQVENGGGAA